ncbi:hypothetical protein Tco_1160511 [Tanacetum coccineum]
MDDDKETTKLKQCMEIILDEEEVTIDAIPLAVKSPKIIFSQMLKSFDREDLEDLYKLVKDRHGLTRLVESIDYLLWNDMKIMFKPHVEDKVWKLQNGYKVLEWKLYDSCRVHFLRMQSMQIYMLVEKKYPLTPPTLLMMLEKKLQIDYESEMAYQLCMYQIDTRTTQTRVPQLPQTYRNTNPHVSTSTRVTHRANIGKLILFIVDSGCTKHMMVQGNISINRAYYVEGLNHNLFSVGKFCDADLEVAFRKTTCFVKDLQGNDLLTGNRGSDLYTISLQETTSLLIPILDRFLSFSKVKLSWINPK